MNKTAKGIIAVIVVAGVVYGAYKLSFKNKRAMARFIVKKGMAANLTTLMTFDEGYVKEWYKGVKANKPTFTYNGVEYNTQGGIKVKN